MAYKLKNVKAARRIINGKERDLIVYRSTKSSEKFGGRIPNDRFVPITIDSNYLMKALQNGDLIEEGSETSAPIEDDGDQLTKE